MQYDNCTNCFVPLGGNTVCPSCGHDYTKQKQYGGSLPPFTILNNRYLLGRVLGKGGFGITYVAKDIATDTICAIKEYMPSEYSMRDSVTNMIEPLADSKANYVFNHGREKFMEEAKTLVRLRDNPIVVDILDFFKQYNTAYLVMEFLNGQDLRGMMRKNGGKMDPAVAKEIFVTIASSLMEVHRLNILHRDLSPENIIVTNDGQVKLIDFGAARNFVSTQNKGMSILLKPGFAPPEQYNAKGAHGPWSDVYALCATFYNVVSGKPLVDALFRYRGAEQPSLYSLGCGVSKQTSDVIDRGMELDYKKRYKDFKEVLDHIDIDYGKAALQPTPRPVPQPTPRPVPQPTPRPVPQPTPQPVPQPMPQPVSQPIPQPATSAPYVATVTGYGLTNTMMVTGNDIFKIGRSVQSCQYVINGDSNISRIHCYIQIQNNKFYLTDVSSNGTFLENGQPLEKNKPYYISPGSKFYLATRNHMLTIGY